MLSHIDDSILTEIAQSAMHLGILRDLQPTSYMCVPLVVRDRILGTFGMVSGTLGRHYGEEDLELVEALAHCSALAIDTAYDRLPEAEILAELVRLAKHEKRILTLPKEAADTPFLTPRQRQMLSLLSQGKSVSDIKAELHLSESTVRNHISQLLQALGARSQVEVLAKARDLGILNG